MKFEPNTKVTVNVPSSDFNGKEGRVVDYTPCSEYPIGVEFEGYPSSFYFAERELEAGWKSDLVILFAYDDGVILSVHPQESGAELAEDFPEVIYFEAVVSAL